MDPIVITGATGNVGAAVIHTLLAGGVRIRAAITPGGRTSQAIQDAEALGFAESVAFDFERPETFAPLFAGARKLFLMRPPHLTDVQRQFRPALEAARSAGIDHVVFLSLIGAERNSFVPHAKIEKLILDLELPHTFLRPSFFMQNLSNTHRQDVINGALVIPAGRGKTSFIDTRDIAAVAALALTEPGHIGRSYPLTGSEALNYFEVASTLSAVLGRPIVYRSPSVLRFMRHMRRQGHPWGFIAVTVGIYLTARFGLAGGLTADTERLLGRPPLTFRQFVQDHRSAWN